MNHAELRAAMIQRFEQMYISGQRTSISDLVDNALAMMPDRAGEFPVGTVDESGRLVTYERRFTVRVAVPHGEKADGYQRARVDVDLDGYMLNSLKVDSNTEAIVNANAEIVQQLIADAATFGIDQPEESPASPEV